MMHFVSEQDIQDLMDMCDGNDKVFFDLQEKLAEKEVAFSRLLTDDSLKLLNEEEFDLLWFMTTIIYGSFTAKNNHSTIDSKILSEIEEQNWALVSVVKNVDFKSKLDVFFEDYKQEDLLAFVEDSLAPDEDMEINPSAREVMFITAKTVVDGLIQFCK